MHEQLTNVYHIYYTPEAKEVSLMFWGCNIFCKGCYCKRRIYSPMLKDFVGTHLRDNYSTAGIPQTYMTMGQIFQALDELDIKDVILEGQEACLDPHFSEITRRLHERYNSNNILLTNLYKMPNLSHIDKVAFGIKALTPELNLDYTGVENTSIIKNFLDIVKSGKKTVVESLFIPDYIYFDEIEKIAKFVSEVDKDMLFVLLPYFKAGFNPWRRPTLEEMKKAAEISKKYLNRVFHFNGDEKNLRDVISVFPDERLIEKVHRAGADKSLDDISAEA